MVESYFIIKHSQAIEKNMVMLSPDDASIPTDFKSTHEYNKFVNNLNNSKINVYDEYINSSANDFLKSGRQEFTELLNKKEKMCLNQ